MRTFKPAVVLILLTLSIPPSFASAALVWEFEVFGSDLSGTGHFEVDAPSSTTGALTQFSYSGQLFGHLYTLSRDDIFEAAWDIDQSDWTLKDLNISSELVNVPGPWWAPGSSVFLDLHLRTGPSASRDATFGVCGAGRMTTCAGEVENLARASSVTFSPIEMTPVPAPTTFLLMASGLLGLVGYRWHQRRREGTQVG